MSALPEPNFHVVLYEPEIPANTGSIGRLCIGTGCRLHLIEPLGFSIGEKAVRRAGLDYWKKVDLVVHPNFDAAMEELASSRIFFASARQGNLFSEHTFKAGDALVFGRESVGLPTELRQRHGERFLRIPTLETIRSLNLSNAVSVVVYEGLRQIRPDFYR